MLRWTGVPDLKADPMRALIAALLLCSTASSASNFVDGNSLYGWCETSRIDAETYVMGVFDAQETIAAWQNRKKQICPPPNLKSSQIRDVVCIYVQQRPERRHLAASSLALTALADAFPCSR